MGKISQELYNKAKKDGEVDEPTIFLKLAQKVVKSDGSAGGTESTGKHIVEFIGEEIVDGIEYQTGKEVKKVEYTLKEDGEKKVYRRTIYKEYFDDDGNEKKKLDYVIERMRKFAPGDKLVMLYVKKGMKEGFIDIQPAMATESGTNDDIPTIDEGDIDD